MIDDPESRRKLIDCLEAKAESGEIVSESETVTKWQGTFDYTFADGTKKEINAAVFFYNTTAQAKLQILDHSINQAQAEAFQDFIAGLFDAKITDREFPSADELRQDHVHEDEEHSHDNSIRTAQPQALRNLNQPISE